MSTVTADEMRELENAAFERGVDPGELMDRAAAGIARRLLNHFPAPGTAVAYIGKGNNGGDALVALEHLRAAGWEIAVRASHAIDELGELPADRLRRLGLEPLSHFQPTAAARPLLLLDGLLGIGASGSLREPLDGLAAEMAGLRADHGAIVAAIDLPSGLDATTGEPPDNGVTADLTVTVGVPKTGLFADAATDACGRLFLVPLDDLPIPDKPGPRLISPETLPGLLPPRPHSAHKGHAGRVAVIAGSPGMDAAAVLCSQAALRAGAGLVTVHLDPRTRITPPPEVMVHHRDDRFADTAESRADALIIGPGLGDTDRTALLAFLENDDRPAVLDADALNAISAKNRHDLLRSNHLITPHPGEFARLAPDLKNLPRIEAATRFVERHPCVLLLKGARTIIAAPDRDPHWNPTGHAGMASGGQGDTLAGVCGALLAAGHDPAEAAMLGAWLCGRAAERALTHGGESEQSCTASDTAAHLGGAFTDWRNRRR